jgi:arylsulfatase A-like enzyme
VIWYGSPHSPQRSLAEDRAGLGDTQLAHHLGEIAGIDRSIGVLRKGLRDLGIEDNTLVWYCSDNGGLTLDPDAVGTLRGHKGELFEGGIRVPGVVEWPGHITPSVTDFPASTMDIFPTLLDLLDLPEEEMLAVHDGESIAPLLAGKIPSRTHGIPFLFQTQAALIEGDYKLISRGRQPARWQLFNLQSDPSETNDLASEETDLFRRLRTEAEAMLQSVEASAEGDDYPEGRVLQPPRDDFWREMPEYRPYLNVITNALPDSGRPARRRRQDASR